MTVCIFVLKFSRVLYMILLLLKNLLLLFDPQLQEE